MHVVHDPFYPEKWNVSFPYLRLLQEEYRKMQQEVKRELDKIIALEKAEGMIIEEFLRD
jgi:hypothetical protein